MSAVLEPLSNGGASLEQQGDDYVTQITKDGPVELWPYGHQVGGHSLLMKFGKAVCKPMIPRERFFYSIVPRELREFTPTYHGGWYSIVGGYVD